MDAVPYDRARLEDILVHHTRDDIKGCRCGWAELGRSWPGHVADVYEATYADPPAPVDADMLRRGGEDDAPLLVCGTVLRFPHYAAPHEPKFATEGRTAADGQPCNRDCPGEWPCEVRQRQRKTIKWLAGDLQSALYRREGGREYARWVNPLGSVTVTYGSSETGIWCQVMYGDQVERETLDADAEFLARGSVL